MKGRIVFVRLSTSGSSYHVAHHLGFASERAFDLWHSCCVLILCILAAHFENLTLQNPPPEEKFWVLGAVVVLILVFLEQHRSTSSEYCVGNSHVVRPLLMQLQ
jgi:hypothetical protein